MTCDVCQRELLPDQHVQVNKVNCHAVDCFAQALRGLKEPIEVALDSSMKPRTAYAAGQVHYSEIMIGAPAPAAPKRRAKKRG